MSKEVQDRIEKMIQKSEAILNAGKEKLKPCPFCGGEASVYEASYMYSAPQYYICCDGCGCEMPVFNTEQDAIEAWNRRVPQRTWTQKVYDNFGKMRDKE